MDKIKDLTVKPQQLPQCQQGIEFSGRHANHMKNWRNEQYTDGDPQKCRRAGKYEIDGKAYCHLHAGQIALKILLADKNNST